MHTRTRIKICGFTRSEDALAAAALGVDAVGLVFYPSSPRYVDTGTAAEISAAMPAFVTVTGLFVNAAREVVEQAIEQVRLDLLQFHGDEPDEYCASFGRPYIKSIGVHAGLDWAGLAARYPRAAGILLDYPDPVLHGGTGRVFDWTRVPHDLNLTLILAGGLTAENVVRAIAAVRPYAVDVSGGVESAKGIKDAAKMAAFVRGVVSDAVNDVEA